MVSFFLLISQKKLFQITILVLCLSGVVSAADYIKNPGFELPENKNKPDEWIASNAQVVVQDTNSYSGNYSAKIISNTNNVSYTPKLENPIEGQRIMRLEFFARAEGCSVYCTFGTKNASSQQLQYEGSATYYDLDGWTRIVYEFTTHPDTSTLTIRLRSGAGTVWYDDVSLKDITGLKNPGFEIADSNGPSHWTASNSQLVVQDPNSYSGDYSAKIISNTNNVSYTSTLANAIEGKNSVRLQFYARTDNSSVYCTFGTKNASSQQLQYEGSPIYSDLDDWTRIVYEFTTHPDTRTLVIRLRSGVGTVWYDDVSLEVFPLKQDNIIAAYLFEDEYGTDLKSESGKNDGTVYDGGELGAEWVSIGDGNALVFDGTDNYVDCGEISGCSSNEITVEAWVYPDDFVRGTPAIVANGVDNYILSYYYGYFLWLVDHRMHRIKAPAPDNRWYHVAATYNSATSSKGATSRIYIDSMLAVSKELDNAILQHNGALYLGRSDQLPKYSRDACFDGKIAGLKIYDTALSGTEIRENYEAGRISLLNHPVINPSVWYSEAEIVAEVDAAGLAKIHDLTSGSVEVKLLDGATTIDTQTVDFYPNTTIADAVLDAGTLSGRSEYKIKATVFDSSNVKTGLSETLSITWPEQKDWTGYENDTEVLNNFVTELLNETPGELSSNQVYSFVNPRSGWVYIASTATLEASEGVSISLNGNSVIDHDEAGQTSFENMQHLAKGSYTIQLFIDGTPSADSLVVRAIPEIMMFDYTNHDGLLEVCNVTREAFGRHRQAEIMETENIADHEERLAAWRASGRRATSHSLVPSHLTNEPYDINSIDAKDFWLLAAGMVHTDYLDGIVCDEFGYGRQNEYQHWITGVNSIYSLPDNDNLFYACCGMDWAQDKLSRDFRETILENGYIFIPEIYLYEEPIKTIAKKRMYDLFVDSITEWQNNMQGSMDQTMVLLCINNHIPGSVNCRSNRADVDFKVFLDMQLNIIANDPAYFGLYGIGGWTLKYSTMEIRDWLAKLYRHYCLEGNTGLLSDKVQYGYKYNPGHISNPDFAEGLDNWTEDSAIQGSIETGVWHGQDTSDGYGAFQRRYHPYDDTLGDTFLLMTKNADNPNKCSQTITGLVAGKKYSIKMITADYGDLKNGYKIEKIHEVSVKIGTSYLTLSSEKYTNSHSLLPDYTGSGGAWLNLHSAIFTAASASMDLTISDWLSETDKGNYSDQKLMCGYIQVQPYFEQ